MADELPRHLGHQDERADHDDGAQIGVARLLRRRSLDGEATLEANRREARQEAQPQRHRRDGDEVEEQRVQEGQGELRLIERHARERLHRVADETAKDDGHGQHDAADAQRLHRCRWALEVFLEVAVAERHAENEREARRRQIEEGAGERHELLEHRRPEAIEEVLGDDHRHERTAHYVHEQVGLRLR